MSCLPMINLHTVVTDKEVCMGREGWESEKGRAGRKPQNLKRKIETGGKGNREGPTPPRREGTTNSGSRNGCDEIMADHRHGGTAPTL